MEIEKNWTYDAYYGIPRQDLGYSANTKHLRHLDEIIREIYRVKMRLGDSFMSLIGVEMEIEK